MSVRLADSSRQAWPRFFACMAFLISKISILRKSGPGLAAPFKDSRRDMPVSMWSTPPLRRSLRLASMHGLLWNRLNMLQAPIRLWKRVEVLDAVVLRRFLSRGLDRFSCLLADQGGPHQNHDAPGAGCVAHRSGPRIRDRDRSAFDDSHSASLALSPALAGWALAVLARRRDHGGRPSFRCLGAGTPGQELEPVGDHQGRPRT